MDGLGAKGNDAWGGIILAWEARGADPQVRSHRAMVLVSVGSEGTDGSGWKRMARGKWIGTGQISVTLGRSGSEEEAMGNCRWEIFEGEI